MQQACQQIILAWNSYNLCLRSTKHSRIAAFSSINRPVFVQASGRILCNKAAEFVPEGGRFWFNKSAGFCTSSSRMQCQKAAEFCAIKRPNFVPEGGRFLYKQAAEFSARSGRFLCNKPAAFCAKNVALHPVHQQKANLLLCTLIIFHSLQTVPSLQTNEQQFSPHSKNYSHITHC